MHERSLIGRLIQQVMEIRKQHGDRNVVAIHLQVGEFSGVDAALLKTAFADTVANTSLHSTALYLQKVPLEARCDTCQREFSVKQFRFECPQCQSSRVTVLRGDELMLDSIVMEAWENESARISDEVA